MSLHRLFIFATVCLAGLSLVGCTNLSWKLLEERLDDNFSGSIAPPGDFTAGTSFSFVAMGDTHIGSPGGEVMKRIVQDSKDRGDSFALVAGDCSQGGLDGELIQFKQVFTDIGFPYYAAIGNHDIFFGGWQNYKKQIGRSVYAVNAGNVHLVFIDTANGIIGRRQFDWLEQDLKNNTLPHVVMISHFPPWIGHFSSVFKLSSEEEDAQLKDLAYRYGVKIFISGHYHGYAENTIGGTKYIVTGGANDIIDLGEKQNYVRIVVNGANISTEKIGF